MREEWQSIALTTTITTSAWRGLATGLPMHDAFDIE